MSDGRTYTLRSAASIVFALTAVIPLLLFTYTLYLLGQLGQFQAQLGLGVALGCALVGLFIFSNLMARLSEVLRFLEGNRPRVRPRRRRTTRRDRLAGRVRRPHAPRARRCRSRRPGLPGLARSPGDPAASAAGRAPASSTTAEERGREAQLHLGDAYSSRAERPSRSRILPDRRGRRPLEQTTAGGSLTSHTNTKPTKR